MDEIMRRHAFIGDVWHPTRRWKEIFCVLFGHAWDTYSSSTDEASHVVKESNTCSRCKLAKRIIWVPVKDEPNARQAIPY